MRSGEARGRLEENGMRTGRVTVTIAALGLSASLAACSISDNTPSRTSPTPRPTPESTAASSAADGTASAAPNASSSAPSADSGQDVVGTVVQFSAGAAVVQVRIEEDTVTTRDFLSLLPMTLRFEDFGGREKVASPPRPFDYRGATGMTPENGDLFSYRPWATSGSSTTPTDSDTPTIWYGSARPRIWRRSSCSTGSRSPSRPWSDARHA